jgi:3-oxoadipate enol-lactonase
MTDHSDAWRGAVQVGNCLIHVAVDGPHKAPRLMLSNSLGSDLTMWDPQLAAFSKHFRVGRAARPLHYRTTRAGRGLSP